MQLIAGQCSGLCQGRANMSTFPCHSTVQILVWGVVTDIGISLVWGMVTDIGVSLGWGVVTKECVMMVCDVVTQSSAMV